jgi:AcrR family transcriptional regulator
MERSSRLQGSAPQQKDVRRKMMIAEPHRRVGRPDQQASEELVRHIVAVATRLFVEQGYAATSLEQIAAEAGSGKQTLYRRFGSKAELFSAVINRQLRRLTDMAEAAETTRAPPIEALKQCCRLLFDFVLTPEVISLQRVMVAEVGRFPELSKTVLESCASPFKALMNRLLQAAGDTGRIQVGDLELTRDLMMSLLTGWPVQQSLFGEEPFETDAARDTYFEAAWSLFLKGAQAAS